MTVKRFVAPDMRRALDMVREEMGPEAIILSSKRVPQGVEIITSLETDQTVPDVDFRQEFGRKFDQDFDSPMASDAAWEAQLGVEQAAQRYLGATQKNNAQEAGAKAKRREALAVEIEQARKKMMAAKRKQENKQREESRLSERYHEAEQGAYDEAEFAPRPQTQRQESRAQFDTRPQLDPRFNNADYARVREQHADNYGWAQQPQQSATNNADFGNWQPDYYNEPEPSASSALDQQMAGLAAELQNRVETQNKASEFNDARLTELQNQIADMRLILEQQVWGMREANNSGARAALSVAEQTIGRHLNQLGLPEALVSELASCARSGKHLSQAWREALATLARKITTPQADVVNSKGGVFALVGPTGVGKTTTIAKLASRYVLEHGIGKVALVTTDTYRVGAHDQLRALGRILNVPVRVADKERPLASVVASLKNYPLILVDTAGFRQGDPLLKEQEAMLANCPGLQRILVLACNSQMQTLKASAHAFGASKLQGCVLTKLDETASLGEALGVVIAQKLPVFYTSDGQGIPHDLAAATAHNLVAKAVSIMKAAQTQGQEVPAAL